MDLQVEIWCGKRVGVGGQGGCTAVAEMPFKLCNACMGLQVESGEPICWLSSANLLEVAPTFHIARFLPSILDSKAPFTFALQVCHPLLGSSMLWLLFAQA